MDTFDAFDIHIQGKVSKPSVLLFCFGCLGDESSDKSIYNMQKQQHLA
jgi:hypothetical protein